MTDFLVLLLARSKDVMHMKVSSKIALVVLVIAFAVPFSSCSKKTFGGKNYASRNTASPTIDPVTKKSEPVRKNYVIPGKRKKILGQNKPKI
jgi:hypothetical protein